MTAAPSRGLGTAQDAPPLEPPAHGADQAEGGQGDTDDEGTAHAKQERQRSQEREQGGAGDPGTLLRRGRGRVTSCAPNTRAGAGIPLRAHGHRRGREGRVRTRAAVHNREQLRGRRHEPVAPCWSPVGRLRIGGHHLGGIRVIDDLPRIGRIVVPGDLIDIIFPVAVALGDGCGVHDVGMVIRRGEFRGVAARMLRDRRRRAHPRHPGAALHPPIRGALRFPAGRS